MPPRLSTTSYTVDLPGHARIFAQGLATLMARQTLVLEGDMFASKKIMTVSGFPILVDLTFLVLAGLLAFQNFGSTWDANLASLLRVPVLFAAILVHELGHAWAIKHYGYGKSRILLWGMGGLCMNRANYNDKDGLKIVLAGPIAGALLGLPALAGLFLLPELSVVTPVLEFAIFVTLGWSVFNLLPIFPLDGGRALMYTLRLTTKMTRDKAARIAGLVGLIVLVPLAIWALSTGQWWTVLILFLVGQTTWKAWKYGYRAAVGG